MKFAESINRLGTESAFVVLARAQELAAQGKDIINLGIGQPDFSTPDHIVEAGIKALRDGHHVDDVRPEQPGHPTPGRRHAEAARRRPRHELILDR